MAKDYKSILSDIEADIRYLEEKNAKLENQIALLKGSKDSENITKLIMDVHATTLKLYGTKNIAWHEALDLAAVEVAERYGIYQGGIFAVI